VIRKDTLSSQRFKHLETPQPSGVLPSVTFFDKSGFCGKRRRNPIWPENLITAKDSSMI
jgi:hypothetical protein